MHEEEAKHAVSTGNQQSRYYYGTFQGVANYYPPSSQPVVGFPQPVPPNALFPGHAYQNVQGSAGGFPNYSHGYQTAAGCTVVIDGRPMREHRLPCCGMGMGWFLFIIGFFFAGIPWYIGTFILLFVHVDYREKPGYVACAIASILCMIAIMVGATRSDPYLGTS